MIFYKQMIFIQSVVQPIPSLLRLYFMNIRFHHFI